MLEFKIEELKLENLEEAIRVIFRLVGVMKKQVVYIMQMMKLFMYMILGRRNSGFKKSY